jgi:tetratricopeptide (TPR) repeat protein
LQFDRAIEDFNQAIRLNPNHTEALSNRGAAYNGKGQYDRAIEDFNQAIRLNPNLAIAFYNRGFSWERKNDLQRALADFMKFSELAPSDPDGPKAVERVTKALSGR